MEIQKKKIWTAGVFYRSLRLSRRLFSRLGDIKEPNGKGGEEKVIPVTGGGKKYLIGLSGAILKLDAEMGRKEGAKLEKRSEPNVGCETRA